MKTRMNWKAVCAVGVGIVLIGMNARAQVVIHPLPKELPGNSDFAVKVRTPGGSWQELSPITVQVDMHNVRDASLATFDFAGLVEISITLKHGLIQSARIRPLSYGIQPEIRSDTLAFTLAAPRDLSIEINGDQFHNLHLFTNPLETNRPDANDPNVIYLQPGFHTFTNGLNVPSGKTLYLAGGAVVNGTIRCQNATNVHIAGRGISYQARRGVEVTMSTNVSIEGLIFVNPQHYTVYGGQSKQLTIKNIRAFSCKGWSDGIDLMSCCDALVDGVFMRNSDDCIALYGHRWDFYGDVTNIVVRNSTLWADVAHPILIGTHGDPASPETLGNMTFTNLDILEHDEPQINYQGCLSINVSDENRARDIRFENIRVEDFAQGQLVNLRVTYNKKYAHAPGRGIENVLFKNITYDGSHANISVISGFDETRAVRNVTFENLTVNGRMVSNSDAAHFSVGEHVENLEFR